MLDSLLSCTPYSETASFKIGFMMIGDRAQITKRSEIIAIIKKERMRFMFGIRESYIGLDKPRL